MSLKSIVLLTIVQKFMTSNNFILEFSNLILELNPPIGRPTRSPDRYPSSIASSPPSLSPPIPRRSESGPSLSVRLRNGNRSALEASAAAP